jgi:hypothetical protein
MSRENLSPKERWQLGQALVAAFDRDHLERLVSFSLDQDLAAITTPGDLDDVAFQLVKWVIRYGQLAVLVDAAFHEIPGNPKLLRFRHEVWEGQRTPAAAGAKDETRAALNAARAQAIPPASHGAPKSIDCIDRSALIKFDLLEQETFIRKHLPERAGAVAFALGGHRTMLNDYLVERIHQDIARNGPRIKRKDAYLVARGLPTLGNGQSPITPVIARACGCVRVADLFDQPQLDVLLVIWNYDIPLTEMKRMATAFWDEQAAQVACSMEGYRRRLIALWVNSDKAPLDAFLRIPKIKPFDVKKVTDHVQNQLECAGVDAERIGYYVTALEGLGGTLPKSFELMQQIIEEVAGGMAR